jgi:hypothetical protein
MFALQRGLSQHAALAARCIQAVPFRLISKCGTETIDPRNRVGRDHVAAGIDQPQSNVIA